jgi:hypothetical protein
MLYTPLFLLARARRARKQALMPRRLRVGATANDVAQNSDRFTDLLDTTATADELEAAALEAQEDGDDRARLDAASSLPSPAG